MKRNDYFTEASTDFSGKEEQSLASNHRSGTKTGIKTLDKKNVEELIGLTPMQEGMLFHYLKEDQKRSYFEQLCINLRGEIDNRLFEKAWNRVIETNQMLRTLFRWEELKEPVQIVLKNHQPDFKYYDLSGTEHVDARLEEIKERDSKDTFDLQSVPFRIMLCKTSARQYQMILSHHHILYDGWSNGIILKEFFDSYENLAKVDAQIDVSLLPLKKKTPFKEFVQRLRLSNNNKDEQEKFWKHYLAGFDAQTKLSIIGNRKNQDLIEPGNLQIQLPEDLRARLEELTGKYKITLAALLYGTWGLLLQRYNNSRDVIFGTTVSGRDAAVNDIQDMVGLFINTLPFRVQAGPKEKIRDFLFRMNKKLQAMGNYEKTPLVKIKEFSQLSHNEELFDNIMVIENYPLDSRLGADSRLLKAGSYQMNEISHYALTVGVTIFKHMEITFSYNKELITEEDIQGLARHYLNILGEFADSLNQTEKTLSSIRVLSEAERKQVLYDFNDTALPFGFEQTIIPMVEEQAAQNPGNIAVTIEVQGVQGVQGARSEPETRSLTYGQLNERANRLAHYLLARGVKPDMPVALALERSPDMIVTMLGIMKAGGAYLPIDIDYPKERIAFMLKDSGVRFLVTTGDWADCHKGIESIDPNIGVSPEIETANPGAISGPANLAYIIYTSGTTGRPKGVLIRHRNLTSLIYAHRDIFAEDQGDCFSQVASPGFDAMVAEVWPALACGASLAIVHNEIRMDPAAMKEWLIRHRVSISFQPTAVAEQLLVMEWPEQDVKLRVLKSAGDKLTRYPTHSYPFDLFNLYGPTEDTVWTTSASIKGDTGDGRLPTIGRPIANHHVYILSDDLKLQPVGVPGQLCIAGEGVAAGYLNRPTLTKEKFVDNPFPEVERIYKTGDIARWLPQGDIEFIGRNDNQVKIRGIRIEQGEIEQCLRRLDAVSEACVTVHYNKAGDGQLVAYVVSDREFTGNDAQENKQEPLLNLFRDSLKEKLPAYMVPSFFVLLDALPLTANGKVDRKALPAPSVASQYTAPRDDTEKRLVEIWAEVLAIEIKNIGIDDNFFELGGHSLNAVKVSSAIHKRLNVRVQLTTLFNGPTIRELAIRVKELEQEKFSAIEPVKDQQYYPLSSAQKRLFFMQQMNPHSTAYNLTQLTEMSGNGGVEKINTAFTKLIRRHECLRTSFHMIDGEPVQRVHPEMAFSTACYQAGGDTPDAASQEQVIKCLLQPFDLSHAPLLRVSLVKNGGTKNILLTDMHHIISDGVSHRILIEDLAAFIRGEDLPPLKIQYKDFAQWQNRLFDSGKLEKQESYWLKQFSHNIPVLNLPTDYARPAVKSYEGAVQEFSAGKETVGALNRLARKEGVTLFMILLAAYYIMLAKLSGQEDIVIGTAVAGRGHPDLEKIAGVFINTLALRNFPENEKSFMTFLGDLRENVLNSFENQEYPFEDLVEKLTLERNTSRNPLFDVTFALDDFNADMDTVFAGGAGSLKQIPNPHETVSSKFDLTLTVSPGDDELLCSFQYSTALFEEETVSRFRGYYKNILSCVLDDSLVNISDIDMLSPDERERILYAFNETEAGRPYEKTICRIFEEYVDNRPDHIAVVETGMKAPENFVTYSGLNQRANRLARVLRGQNVVPDTIVAIMLDKSIEMIVAILAVLKAGGAYLPLDPDYPPERLDFMLKDSGVSLLITRSAFLSPDLQPAATTLLLDSQKQLISRQSARNLPETAGARNLAYIIYTSGSTGLPKGVAIEHRSVANLKTWQARAFNISWKSHILQFFSYSFDGAVGETFMALLNGATLVMFNLRDAGVDRLVRCINTYRINLGVFVPSMLRRMDPDELDAPGELTVVSVGEACTPDLVYTWAEKCNFVNGYGPTETTVYSHTWNASREEISQYRQAPIGKPISNYKSYALDSHLHPVPVGVVGELYISGVGLARGYHHRAQTTFERFIPNPFFLAHQYAERGAIRLESAEKDLARFSETHSGSISRRYELAVSNVNDVPPETIMELVRHLDADLVESTRSLIAGYRDDAPFYKSFCRYLYEGMKHTYCSCGLNADVLEELMGKKINGLKGVDFGFGNAETMELLAAAGARVSGFDLSPFFVERAREKGLNARMLKVDTPLELFEQESGIGRGSQDFAISTLVLDRVANPENLILNLLASLKKGGVFALQTLLPIIPEDDGDIDEPIVYTTPENQVTPGKKVEEDKRFLVALLYQLGARNIRVSHIPFAVSSNDGIQYYKVWSFAGVKQEIPAACDDDSIYAWMYKTGDLVRYFADGNIGFLGRSDHQVKIRGFRIEPGEIENRLLEHPGIGEALVVVKDDENGDKYLAAYLVAGEPVQVADLRSFLLEKLPAYMAPSYFTMLEEMPLTPNGKINMKALPEPDTAAKERGEPNALVRPVTETEKAIAGLWSEVLGLEEDMVDIHDNFFEMGGHSLKATSLAAKIHETLNVKIPLGEIFKSPTIHALAQYVSNSGEIRYAAISTVEEKEYYPLSSSQGRLYALNRMDPGNTRYNMPIVVTLEGHVDKTRLEDTFDKIIKRHEILRTSFIMPDDTPLQRVHRDVPFEVEYYDAPEIAAKSIVNDFVRPFDLSRAPLLRAGLIRTASNRFIFMADLYHIVSDGVSANLFINDFRDLYNGKELAPLNIQYKDFAQWQNRMLQSEEIRRQEEYWLNRFEGEIPRLQLPYDYPDASHHRLDQGDLLVLQLEKDLSQHLYETVNRAGVTVYTILLAVYNILLSRYTEQQDIILGAPVAGRRHADMEKIMGMFVNMLAMRNFPGEDKTFERFLAEVKDNAVNAYENQDYQFENLVRKLGIIEHVGNPLCNVVFVMQKLEHKIETLRDAKIQAYPFENKTVKFDLQLEIIEDGDEQSIRMEWNYPSALFNLSTVESMARHYVEILEQVLEDGEIKLKDIQLSHDLLEVDTGAFQEDMSQFAF